MDKKVFFTILVLSILGAVFGSAKILVIAGGVISLAVAIAGTYQCIKTHKKEVGQRMMLVGYFMTLTCWFIFTWNWGY